MRAAAVPGPVGAGSGAAAAIRLRAVPGRLMAPLAALALPLYFVPGTAHGLGFSLWVVLAALAAWEARVLRRSIPRVERLLPARLSLGEQNPVVLRFDNPGARGVVVRVRDDVPPTLFADTEELRARVPAGDRTRVTYQVVPTRRGRHAFGALHMRIDGRFGLCDRVAVVPAAADVSVYPNTRATRRYALAAKLGTLPALGIAPRRDVRGGGELEQLRGYVPGDPYREIDWKATAKRLRPIVREHGDERAQTVLVALDVGRMMATTLGPHRPVSRGDSPGTAGSLDPANRSSGAGDPTPVLTKLDHAIQAALLLTHVALGAGDRVGLVLFADDVHAFVPPMRGAAQYGRVLAAVHDAQAAPTFVDFRRLAEFLGTRVPRRSLLVVFSDLMDESQAGPICDHVGRLRRKHLPVCVTIEDPVPAALSAWPPETEEDAFVRAAAADLLAERAAIRARLRKAGVGLLEVPVSDLAIASVNRYLHIKRRREL